MDLRTFRDKLERFVNECYAEHNGGKMVVRVCGGCKTYIKCYPHV